MTTHDNRQKVPVYVRFRFMSMLFTVLFMLGLGILGCDIVKEKPSILTDMEKKFGKNTPQGPGQAAYKTIEESTTLKIITVDPHEDLKALGQQLANEAKDKPVFEVDVYDDENQAKNYRIRMDPSISKEDAAFEDNEAHLVAIYRKNTNQGENFIEIYNDISHEDTEIVRF